MCEEEEEEEEEVEGDSVKDEDEKVQGSSGTDELVCSKVLLARAIGCCSVLVTMVFVGGAVTMPARKQTKKYAQERMSSLLLRCSVLE